MRKPYDLYCEDCFDVLPTLPSNSVDMVLCDLPYGQLARNNPFAQWDNELPIDKLWELWREVLKPGGVVVLFGNGMFTAKLMVSNPKWWRYNLIWHKDNRPTGFLNAKRQPLRIHEDILVFYEKATTYNPQFTLGVVNHRRGNAGNAYGGCKNRCYSKYKQTQTVLTREKYPTSVLTFAKERKQFHPTQKPVQLCEWLIRTYSNEGEVVLDNCMGVGSSGVAAMNCKRNFIGIEKDERYFAVAQQRITNHQLTI